jgi:Flp pilus assembly pilin Flp
MLKYYVKTTEALKRLRTDKDGVVSFEYIIVAFCIVAAVAAVFGTANSNGISSALNTALGNVITAFNTATTATP